MKRKMIIVAMAVSGLLVFLLMFAQTAVRAEPGDVTKETTRLPLEIINQTGIKVVAQINYSDTMSKGISKQVMAVRNLYDRYTALA